MALKRAAGSSYAVFRSILGDSKIDDGRSLTHALPDLVRSLIQMNRVTEEASTLVFGICCDLARAGQRTPELLAAAGALGQAVVTTGIARRFERPLAKLSMVYGAYGLASHAQDTLRLSIQCGRWPSIFFYNDVLKAVSETGDIPRLLVLYSSSHEWGLALSPSSRKILLFSLQQLSTSPDSLVALLPVLRCSTFPQSAVPGLFLLSGRQPPRGPWWEYKMHELHDTAAGAASIAPSLPPAALALERLVAILLHSASGISHHPSAILESYSEVLHLLLQRSSCDIGGRLFSGLWAATVNLSWLQAVLPTKTLVRSLIEGTQERFGWALRLKALAKQQRTPCVRESADEPHTERNVVDPLDSVILSAAASSEAFDQRADDAVNAAALRLLSDIATIISESSGGLQARHSERNLILVDRAEATLYVLSTLGAIPSDKLIAKFVAIVVRSGFTRHFQRIVVPYLQRAALTPSASKCFVDVLASHCVEQHAGFILRLLPDFAKFGIRLPRDHLVSVIKAAATSWFRLQSANCPECDVLLRDGTGVGNSPLKRVYAPMSHNVAVFSSFERRTTLSVPSTASAVSSSNTPLQFPALHPPRGDVSGPRSRRRVHMDHVGSPFFSRARATGSETPVSTCRSAVARSAPVMFPSQQLEALRAAGLLHSLPDECFVGLAATAAAVPCAAEAWAVWTVMRKQGVGAAVTNKRLQLTLLRAFVLGKMPVAAWDIYTLLHHPLPPGPLPSISALQRMCNALPEFDVSSVVGEDIREGSNADLASESLTA